MKRDEATNLWNEICFLLSSNIKSGISEKDFEQQVVRVIEKLGWAEFKGEIVQQASIQFGRKALRPDLVIVDSDNKASVPIEIKRPAEDLSNDHIAGQLKSYMLQLKAKFGLVIGDGIKLFYDGPEKDNIIDDPLLLKEVAFQPSSEDGIDFVSNFNKTVLLSQSYKPYIANLIEKVRAKRNINQLKEDLLSSATVERIVDFLRKEYREFGSDIVDEALSSITINLCIDSRKISMASPVEPPKGLPASKDRIVEQVFDIVSKNQAGIEKAKLISISGLKKRQVTNALYKLSRQGRVSSPERGVYIPRTVSSKTPTRNIPNIKSSFDPKELSPALRAVYKAVARKKNGNTIEEIELKSGYFGKQINNALYKLSKRGLVEKVKNGHWIATEHLHSNKKNSGNDTIKAGQDKSSTGILETIFSLISNHKNGLDLQSIKEKTGFEARQLSNALYKLTKRGRVEAIERGKYIAI